MRPARPLLALALFAAACGGAPPPDETSAARAEIPAGVHGPWREHPELSRLRVPVAGAPARGADVPLVEIVAFSDFECSFCRRSVPVLERLLEEHGDAVRLRFRHVPLPFHEHAEQAAIAAEEARAQRGDAGFWAMHDRLFAADDLSTEALVAHAEAMGLDVERFRLALRGRVHAETLGRDLELAARLGVDGTPTFFVNGRPVLGAQPYRDFEPIVRQEIELAREALARGVPRARVYEAAMRAARRRPPPPPRREARGRPRRELDPDVTYRVPVEGAPSLGPADAPVTVVIFSDFECPYCARAVPTVHALRERFGDRLRLVFRHHPLPFHRHAFLAAQAAREAWTQGGDEAFWRFHDRLFENQDALRFEDLVAHARAAGLDADRFEAALEDGTHEVAVEEDQQLARRLGARGTPMFYVNGRFVQGAQPLPVFVAAVEDALGRAEAERDRGTAPEDVYGALMDDASPEAVWRAPEERPAPPERAEIEVPAHAPRRGAEEPALVIQTFSDFQCPFCGRVQPTLARLLDAFPQVQLVFRHHPLPFHRDARPAAIAAIEVQRQLGDEAFWRFHDLLFANQRALSRDALLGYAAQVGADRDAVAAALDDETHADAVDADVTAVREAGLRIGTPAFLIGDRLLMGAQPYVAFEAAVREELGDTSANEDSEPPERH
ncbi:MAG TPA: thioredoxin domain-containing protein [Sandaracinaceae bacterium LLY-WYZ-13_1]|nr:thioredoxin domain-containing protein [Sandaracinaceae bacterium LLY-WYZ-13_1]